MDSAVSYAIQAVTDYGLPVAVSLIVGFAVGYFFFRARSEDERGAVMTIKAANEDLGKKLEDAEEELRSLWDAARDRESCIAALQEDIDRLENETRLSMPGLSIGNQRRPANAYLTGTLLTMRSVRS